jgi:hypothetical protein
MEKKNRNPLPPHYPEQEAFEEYTNPDPNEITPQQYENPDNYRRQREQSDDKVILEDGEGKNGKKYDIDEDDEVGVIDEEEDDEENSGYSNQLDNEDEYLTEEEDEENKSPLRPIDANKSPEEWRSL